MCLRNLRTAPYIDSITLLFWFDLILEARVEILTKISLVFLVDLVTPKEHFEINWPLLGRLEQDLFCIVLENFKKSSHLEIVNNDL